MYDSWNIHETTMREVRNNIFVFMAEMWARKNLTTPEGRTLVKCARIVNTESNYHTDNRNACIPAAYMTVGENDAFNESFRHENKHFRNARTIFRRCQWKLFAYPQYANEKLNLYHAALAAR